MTKKECTLALQESKNLSKNKANNTMRFILKYAYENVLKKGIRKIGDMVPYYNKTLKDLYLIRIERVRIAEDSLSVTIKYSITLKAAKSKIAIFKFKKEYTFDEPSRVKAYIKAKENRRKKNNENF
jgi:hypothetical protein